ncbi:hypothetical protein [Neolewinella persica]|uniref:hypothetical protein n=1 Tax=Neolewinella persica TaxID=70998 RepID=UPI0012FCD109|nr:hypothetical protein [Neolewinella persica]
MKKVLFLCILFTGVHFLGATSISNEVALTNDKAFLQEMLALETLDPGDPPPQEGFWCTATCVVGWGGCMLACSSDLSCEDTCNDFLHDCSAFCDDPVGTVIWGPAGTGPNP